MMELVVLLIAITSIWVLGLTIATQEGMLLYSLRDAATDKSGRALFPIYEPLIVCHWCMPSLHSIIGYVFAWGMGYIGAWSWNLILIYPLVVMGSSLLCGIVWAIYQLLETSRKYYKTAEKNHFIQLKNKVVNHKNRQHGNKPQLQTNKKQPV